MSYYTIQRTQFKYNKNNDSCITRDETLPGKYHQHNLADNKIKKYAEACHKESKLIQHHAGISVVFFNGGYVEFHRNALKENLK